MSWNMKTLANRRSAPAACAAVLVALAAAPQLDGVAAASGIVVRQKVKSEAAAGDSLSEQSARDEYYLDFNAAAPLDTLETDTLDYLLEFESGAQPDSMGQKPEVREIYIDDDGVVIDSLRAGPAVRIGVSGWDESDDERVSEECCYSDDQLDLSLDLGYQRVDGLSLGFRQDLDHHDWRVPRIRLREIYSSKQDKWFYDVGIEQRLFSFAPLYVGAAVYKITDSNSLDEEIIGDTENTIAAFFLKEDYRDYFTRDGTTLHARLDLPLHSSVKIEYLDDRYDSLSRQADWSLFRSSRMFRPNLAIDDGHMNSLIASYMLNTVDSDKCVPSGAMVRLSAEKAGDGLGGDFEFTTVTLDARNFVKLNPSQFLRYRLMIGSRTKGALPVQREFYVGGIGTLRGHDYKELTGDQMVLGNIEYGAYAGRDMGIYVFVDSGKAWLGDGGFKDQRLELDVGVGIELLCRQTQIYAARNVKDPDSPILVGVRLNRTF